MKRAEEFWDYYREDEECWHDVPTQLGLNIFNDDDVLAYTIAAAWALYDKHYTAENGCLIHDIITGAIFMSRSHTQDAAVQWVKEKFGADAANELDCSLDKDEAEQLYKKRDAELEVETNSS